MTYKTVPHGTHTCYKRGCRERVCLDAHRDYNRANRLRRTGGKSDVAPPVETLPPPDCVICLSPLSEHRPYYLCRISA